MAQEWADCVALEWHCVHCAGAEAPPVIRVATCVAQTAVLPFETERETQVLMPRTFVNRGRNVLSPDGPTAIGVELHH
jgi:hypothetical protein